MAQRTCSIEGCAQVHLARGWCSTHYQRWRKTGNPIEVRPNHHVVPSCSVDGCDRISHAQGYCTAHYQRCQVHGDPQPDRPLRIRHDDEARFWSKVEKGEPADCWLWTGVIDQAGYGRIDLGRTTRPAHRFSYEINIGPIPDGLEVDHVHAWGCRHHNCVNPAHLEAVTGAENKRRRWEASRA